LVLEGGIWDAATFANVNLASDIGEATDLAASQPAKLAEMQTQWDAWNATLVAPLWGADKRVPGGGAAVRGPAKKPAARN
jgi:predicted cobalt transporter CbtA